MRPRRSLKGLLLLAVFFTVVATVQRSNAQTPQISYITPDAAAKGMTVAVEFIGPAATQGNFGADGVYAPGDKIRLRDASDSNYVIIGPAVVSWTGRMVQCMVFVREDAPNRAIPIIAANGTSLSAAVNFSIVAPQTIVATGGGVIGGGIGTRTSRGTIVVDSMILNNGTYNVATSDIDNITGGNQGFLPLRILSRGPIQLNNATINLNGSDAASGTSGGSGGVGGGGGGGGAIAAGGPGYTGGGAVGQQSSSTPKGGNGTGSATGSSYYHGGISLNGALGGDGVEFDGVHNDEGGGGGTGHPFGRGGLSGAYGTGSFNGQYGGGSGGGQDPTASFPSITNTFAGGGGGFATAGVKGGGGNGNNGGHVTGNPMLIPLAGGSGGGSGNMVYNTLLGGGAAGCGGGGGGALELTTFGKFMMPSGSITATGGKGSNGTGGTPYSSPSAGGGGSGGAVLVSARDSILIGTPSGNTPVIAIVGGAGGSKGGGNSQNGGAGGVGRVRVDGRVSRYGGQTIANYFTTTKDYVGPVASGVQGDRRAFAIYGFGRGWGGADLNTSLTIYYRYPSTGWQTTTVTTQNDPTSFTAKWVSQNIPRSSAPQDSVLFVAALQEDKTWQNTADDFTREPQFIMGHTSGLIAHVGLPKIDVRDSIIDFGKITVGNCSADSILQVLSLGNAPLKVDPAIVSGDKKYFNIKRLDTLRIAQGNLEKIAANFCPTDTGCFSVVVRFNSNDTTDQVILRGCGVLGKLSMPDTIDFGSVVVGTCKDSAITVTNTGSDTITVRNAPSLGSEFTVPPGQFPFVLPPDSSKQLIFRYCPTIQGLESSIDSLRPDAPAIAKRFVLLGKGVEGILTTPSSIDLGCVVLGTTAIDTVTFRNPGTAAVTSIITQIQGTTDVTITKNLASAISANSSDMLIVSFTATTLGQVSGKIVVTSSTATVEVPITAHVSVAPDLLILDSVLAFDTVAAGDTKKLCARVMNPSCIPVRVSGETLIGNNTNFFSIDATTPITLVDSAVATICVTFAPNGNTVSNGTITLSTSVGDKGIRLTGQGATPSLDVRPKALDFGDVLIATTSPAQRAQVFNTGLAPTTLAQPVLAGPNAAEFAFTAVRNTIGVLDSVGYDVTLTPATVGNKLAYLVFTFGNAKDSVVLTGRGVKPGILVTRQRLDFGKVQINPAPIPTLTFSIHNTGTAPLTVSDLQLTGDPSFSFVATPTPPSNLVNSNDSIQVTVSFNPTAVGVVNGQITVKNSTSDEPLVDLIGEGINPNIAVILYSDTIITSPGKIIRVPIKTKSDMTNAGVKNLQFDVTFDPMLLDFRKVDLSNSIVTSGTVTPKKNSFGDYTMTITTPDTIKGTGTLAEMEMEVLANVNRSSPIHITSAAFGASPVTLASVEDGAVISIVCDTTEKISLTQAPMIIMQNRPNPFADQTEIAFTVGVAGHVKIEVRNVFGEVMKTLIDNDLPIGSYSVRVDAHAMAMGAYEYRSEWTKANNTPVLITKKFSIVR